MQTLEREVHALMRAIAAEQESDRRSAWREVRMMLDKNPKPTPLDPETQLRKILLELGAPEHLQGHAYVVYAVMLVIEDRTLCNSITLGIYPQVAAHFNTTAPRVERSIRNLVEVTWSRGDLGVIESYFGNTVDPKKGKPTNGEFIARLSSEVQFRCRAA